MSRQGDEAIAALVKLRPQLERDRETHRQWAEELEANPDEDTSKIGDSGFHRVAVMEYDQRIAAVDKAIAALAALDE